MERIYNKEDAKKRMQRSVNFYQIRIEAWENVERVTKKDGSDFAILSKNFKNCEFLTEYGSNKIRVHFHTNENGYEHDDIYLDGDGYGRQAATTPEAVQDFKFFSYGKIIQAKKIIPNPKIQTNRRTVKLGFRRFSGTDGLIVSDVNLKSFWDLILKGPIIRKQYVFSF